jgi:hypothetical protein
MRELSGAELDLIAGGNRLGSCRLLTWWERQKVAYVELFFGEDVARDVARRYAVTN